MLQMSNTDSGDVTHECDSSNNNKPMILCFLKFKPPSNTAPRLRAELQMVTHIMSRNYITKKSGPRTEPRGTPYFVWEGSTKHSLTLTICCRSIRYGENHVKGGHVKGHCHPNARSSHGGLRSSLLLHCHGGSPYYTESLISQEWGTNQQAPP